MQLEGNFVSSSKERGNTNKYSPFFIAIITYIIMETIDRKGSEMEETKVYSDKDMNVQFGLGVVAGACALGITIMAKKAWATYRSKRDEKTLLKLVETPEEK